MSLKSREDGEEHEESSGLRKPSQSRRLNYSYLMASKSQGSWQY
jgi:hypothetical protein